MDKDLIFTTSDGTFSVRYSKIDGWITGTIQETQMVPHRDPKLAAQGEREATGGKRAVEHITLLGQQPMQLSPVASVEFKKFIKERIKPEIWRENDPGEPEYHLLSGVTGVS